jgi:hypothetical protein
LCLLIIEFRTMEKVQKPSINECSLIVSWQRIHKSNCNFKSRIMSSCHCLISFLPLFYNLQLNSIPLLPSSDSSRLVSRNSSLFYVAPVSFGPLLFNHFARTTQKTQLFYYWKDVFTAPLHSNGTYSIIACIFVVAGMCLPSHCLAMDIYLWIRYSGFRA